MAGELKGTATVTLNGKQAGVELEKLERKAIDLRKSIVEVNKSEILDKKKLKNLKSELSVVNTEMKQIKKSTNDYKQVLANLDGSSINQLRTATVQLNRELNKLPRNTQAYIDKSKQLAKVKATFDNAKKSVRELGKEIDRSGAKTKNFKSRIGGMADGLNKFGSLMAVAGGALVGFGAIVGKVIDGLMKSSDQLAEVSKTTGLTIEGVKELKSTFDSFETRTANKQLLEFSRIAGKLGIKGKEEISSFVKEANIATVSLGASLGASAEDTVNTLGKIIGSFELEKTIGWNEAIRKTGAVINELGKSSTASEKPIVEYINRLQSIGVAAKIPIEKIAAIGATLDDAGIASEAGASGVMKFISSLSTNVTSFAKMLKVTEGEYKAMLKDDVNAVMIKVLESAKGGETGLLAMTESLDKTDVSGVRMTATVGTLMNKIEKLKEQQAIATKAFAEGTSTQAEYELMNNTFAATVEKVQKKLAKLFLIISTMLQPAIEVAIKLVDTLMDRFSSVKTNADKVGASIKKVADFFVELIMNSGELVTIIKDVYGGVFELFEVIGKLIGSIFNMNKSVSAAQVILNSLKVIMLVMTAPLRLLTWGLIKFYKSAIFVVEVLKDVYSAFVVFTKVLVFLISKIPPVRTAIKVLAGLFTLLKNAVSVAVDVITTSFDFLLNVITTSFENIKKIVTGAINTFTNFASLIADFILTVPLLGSAIKGVVNTFLAFVQVLKDTYAWVTNLVSMEIDLASKSADALEESLERKKKAYELGNNIAKTSMLAIINLSKKAEQDKIDLLKQSENEQINIEKTGNEASLNQNAEANNKRIDQEKNLANELAEIKASYTEDVNKMFEEQLTDELDILSAQRNNELNNLDERLKNTTVFKEKFAAINLKFDKREEQVKLQRNTNEILAEKTFQVEMLKLQLENGTSLVPAVQEEIFKTKMQILDLQDERELITERELRLQKAQLTAEFEKNKKIEKPEIVVVEDKTGLEIDGEALALLDAQYEAGLIAHEDYEKAKRDITLKYLEEIGIQDSPFKSLKSELDRINELFDAEVIEWDDMLKGKGLAMAEFLQASVQIAGDLIGGLITAQKELETSKIEEQQDKQVAENKESLDEKLANLKQAEAQQLLATDGNLKKQQQIRTQYNTLREEANASFNEKEATANETAENKKKQLAKKFADEEFIIKASQIVANTSVAIMQALAQLGPIAGPIAGVVIGATGVKQLQVANAQREKIKGLAEGGEATVERSQDGKLFNAKYSRKRGRINRPTVLVGEEGSEYVVPNIGLQNPSLSGILSSIEASRQRGDLKTFDFKKVLAVKGYADGGTTGSGTANNISNDAENTASRTDELLLMLISTVNLLREDVNKQREAIKAYIVYSDIEDAEERIDEITTVTTT